MTRIYSLLVFIILGLLVWSSNEAVSAMSSLSQIVIHFVWGVIGGTLLYGVITGKAPL